MDAPAAYEQLIAHTRKTATLGSAAAVLGWDQQTYLPPGGAGHRGKQLALLAELTHQWSTDARIGDWLSACEASALAADPASDSAVTLFHLRRDYDLATKLPDSLVGEMAEAESTSYNAWKDARAKSDFAAFAPHLQNSLRLNRAMAECFATHPDPYDTLLDRYEIGATGDWVESVFTPLAASISELLDVVKSEPVSMAQGTFPIEQQTAMCWEVVQAIGFDGERGRLDPTTHPFCTGLGPDDTRLTTRYRDDELLDGISAALHEMGHGLYDQGLRSDQYGLPLGNAVSLGIHESQSRMWENQVGRSRGFCEWWLPILKRYFPDQLNGVSVESLYRALNTAVPSYIRVDADEVTYNLHIVLRFELERALIRGDLSVAELPGAWNERFEQLFGLKVDKDANGCLQDVHWTFAFGYFPTYTLGNLYAAQFYDAAGKELGDLEAQFAAGEFAPLLGWLRRNIHEQGCRHVPGELCKQVTGADLDPNHLLTHLRSRYQRS